MSNPDEELTETLLRMSRIDRSLAVCGATYDSLRRQFDAASYLGDGKLTQQYRNGIHETLDEILDLLGSQMTLKRRMMQLMGYDSGPKK